MEQCHIFFYRVVSQQKAKHEGQWACCPLAFFCFYPYEKMLAVQVNLYRVLIRASSFRNCSKTYHLLLACHSILIFVVMTEKFVLRENFFEIILHFPQNM